MDRTSTKAFTYESFINRAYNGQANFAVGADPSFMQSLIDMEAGLPVKNQQPYTYQMATVKRHITRAIERLPKTPDKKALTIKVQQAETSEDLILIINCAYNTLDQDFN